MPVDHLRRPFGLKHQLLQSVQETQADRTRVGPLGEQGDSSCLPTSPAFPTQHLQSSQGAAAGRPLLSSHVLLL